MVCHVLYYSFYLPLFAHCRMWWQHLTWLDLKGPLVPMFHRSRVLPNSSSTCWEERRTSNQRGTLQYVWVVENSSDCDDPTVHKRDIRGEGDHQKLTIHYMVIPNVIEARITVVLLLREDADGYKLSGSIKAWGSEMDRGVNLFSNQTWNVPGGKRFEIPLMVSKVYMPWQCYWCTAAWSWLGSFGCVAVHRPGRIHFRCRVKHPFQVPQRVYNTGKGLRWAHGSSQRGPSHLSQRVGGGASWRWWESCCQQWWVAVIFLVS